MKCLGFGLSWMPGIEDCDACKKSAKVRYNKCKKATEDLVKETCSTDEEIEKWLKDQKNKKGKN
ncbi:hypothetical protein LCGC14_0608700 [marine sediment metagenome]|uniref:Uncharacterized protein n=1 Tax=marine sediment metagenome TaxID=412755 RepID=A0A0F9TUP4_9ZZZZ